MAGLATGLTACAISNEGAVDYRKAEIAPPQEQPVQASTKVRTALIRQGLPTHDDEAQIGKDDSISISLRRAFIREFFEIMGNPFSGDGPNGEIAIVVKAFEFGDGKDFDFGPDGAKEGRVVFYSADVEKDQFLNFNNMPVYGPITYKGNPIGLDIFVLELDVNNEQISALLTTLANFGAEAYPPASPILPVLDSLGKALLKGGINDTEFRFSIVLDPAGGDPRLYHPLVEAGDYVFIRLKNRQGEYQWNTLQYDHNEGLLYKDGELYRENTYMTFQIDKNESSTDIDLSQNTFEKLMLSLQQEDKARAEGFDELQSEFETLALAQIQARNFSDSRDLLQRWKAAKAANNAGSPEAKQAAYDLIARLKASIKAEAETDPDKKEEHPPQLSPRQIDYLLKNLRSMSGKADVQSFAVFERDNFRDKTASELFAEITPMMQ